MKNRIFDLLERIETITNKTISELNPQIDTKVMAWQDGKVKDSHMLLTLTNYLDILNSEMK